MAAALCKAVRRHRQNRHRLLLAAFLAVVAVAWAYPKTNSNQAQAGEVETHARETEAKVKVAYVFNFLKFVEWPGAERNAPSAPIRICIVGTDPIRTMLGELSIRKIRERQIQVDHMKELEGLRDCHLVYISRSEEFVLPQVLRQFEGVPVLAVSDIPQFAHKGGMIGFATEDSRVKVEISRGAVLQAGLKVSAKLLEIARIVP
jgi:hypothetical protein